jgi:hypothetical protein
MLLNLPVEIIGLVLNQVSYHLLCQMSSFDTETRQLPEKGDLKRVCEVCTVLCDIATPYLYRSVVIEVNERSFHCISVVPFSVPCPTRSSFLQYTQEVIFIARFHKRTNIRCFHSWFEDEEIRDELFANGRHLSLDHQNDAEIICNLLLPFLEACKDGNLQSFK